MRAFPAAVVRLSARFRNCLIKSLRIESLLESIEHRTVRETVRKVFSDLIGLLECLQLVGSSSLPMDQCQEALEVFEIIHLDARAVVSSIQEAMQTAGIEDELFMTPLTASPLL